ncbi:MAG: hypothetical protein AAF927_32690 [Bacteroidota bacterium]
MKTFKSNFWQALLCSFVFSLALLNHSFAQSPEAFKYQAVVRDANNAPLAWQNVSIRISILESSPNGSAVYQEAHNVTTSALGLVSLNLGEGTVLSGTFAGIQFESYDHFLQIEVDESGGTNYYVLGTSQLLSVPYSLFASTAGTALDVDDADADPANELQDISLNGNDLSISQGSTLSLPSLTAGDGIRIDNGVISNLKPSLWNLDSNLVFVDSNQVAIGFRDSTSILDDNKLFVNGNIRLAEDSSLLGIGQMVGASGISLAANPSRDADIELFDNGRVRFEEEVGINQVFSFIDLNVRNQPGNSTVLQIEDTTGHDIFEVGRGRNVGINRITSNVTLQVRNKDVGTNTIIANFERANGNNILQIQDDADVVVTGDFSVTGSKNFILDHPLDPANKTLSHNAVESPDHVTYYHGTVQLDANGNAVVSLPSYFEALNTDFHYQLTCVGGFAQVFIAEEIQNNQFSIAGGQPGMKVSWQVSATRNDPWAQDHPYQAEQDKEPHDVGRYFYPEGYGKGPEYLLDGGETQTKEDQ